MGMTSAADLPDDIDALKAIIMASKATMAEQDGIIERKEDRTLRLEKLLAGFKRALYGAKSEKGHSDQYHLALEDIETDTTACLICVTMPQSNLRIVGHARDASSMN